MKMAYRKYFCEFNKKFEEAGLDSILEFNPRLRHVAFVSKSPDESIYFQSPGKNQGWLRKIGMPKKTINEEFSMRNIAPTQLGSYEKRFNLNVRGTFPLTLRNDVRIQFQPYVETAKVWRLKSEFQPKDQEPEEIEEEEIVQSDQPDQSKLFRVEIDQGYYSTNQELIDTINRKLVKLGIGKEEELGSDIWFSVLRDKHIKAKIFKPF